MKRHVLFAAFAACVLLTGRTGAQSTAPSQAPAASNFTEEVYLTLPEALEQIFGKGSTVTTNEFALAPAAQRSLEKRLGRRIPEKKFTVHRGHGNGKFLGDAVVTEETGLFKKITFIVHVRPEGKIGRVAVLTYREPRGMEVRQRRFLKQYEGKSTGDPVALNRDIVNITGATLSARALSAGVKKILHFIVDVYRPTMDKKTPGKT